jgi:hypothetical protein
VGLRSILQGGGEDDNSQTLLENQFQPPGPQLQVAEQQHFIFQYSDVCLVQ